MVLSGDVNSNLCTSAPCIGHSVLHNKAKPVVVEERQWLTSMLVSHQMTALNSWSHRSCTYSHPPLQVLRREQDRQPLVRPGVIGMEGEIIQFWEAR